MPSFAWQGRCLDGTTRWGIVPATDSAQLRRHLRGRGVALEHSVAVPGWLDGLLAPTTRAIRPRHRAVLLRALATMVSAGIPLHEALEIIGRQEKHAGLRRLIGLLRQDVANGLPLSAALANHPRQFSALVCGLVRAGEHAGELEPLLERIAADGERREATRRRLRKAMLYPLIVLAIAVAVTLGLLMFVVPRFEALFAGFGARLPFFTRQIIAASEWLRGTGWMQALLAVTGAGLIIPLSGHWRALRHWRDGFVLRLPLIGSLLEAAMIARFSRTLAVMLKAGIPLAEALPTMATSLANRRHHDAVLAMARHLRDGRSLAFAVGSVGHFPHGTGQMIATGESAGRLEAMLERIAEREERRVIESVDGLASLLEPAVMSLLGVLVGGLVLAMYLPVFQLGAVV